MRLGPVAVHLREGSRKEPRARFSIYFMPRRRGFSGRRRDGSMWVRLRYRASDGSVLKLRHGCRRTSRHILVWHGRDDAA